MFLIVFYFPHSISVLSFYIDVVLTLFIKHNAPRVICVRLTDSCKYWKYVSKLFHNTVLVCFSRLSKVCESFAFKQHLQATTALRHLTQIIPMSCSQMPAIFVMITSSNGNRLRITGHLCGEFTGHRGIPRTKASDAELCCFLSSAPDLHGLVNNREAGDLRRHRVHHDVIVMSWEYMLFLISECT